MKSVEITDLLVEAMASGKYQFLRCNYPNGDMVGHTGVLSAVITAMEAVDAALARVKEAADKYGSENRLEGYLFPDTYQFYMSDDPANVIDKFLRNFDNKFTDDLYDALDAYLPAQTWCGQSRTYQ